MRPEVTDANKSKCLCPTCPTYNSCMRDNGEGMFCGNGNTECDPKQQGCMCADCAVFAQYNLSGGYFCVEGAAS